MYRSLKTKRTLFTEEKVQALRKNIATYAWAKKQAEKILVEAQVYLDYGTDRLAGMVPSFELKRSGIVNRGGCPFCGMEMMRHGRDAWIIDFVEHPWKVKCPHCGALFPSNDFDKFYESGLDEHGFFSYRRADRSLLVNTLYPEKGPDFAVDDGTGWLADPADPARKNYGFIPFFVDYGLWNGKDRGTGCNAMMRAIRMFATAYLITGDRKYGVPGAMLLHKAASMYPRLDARDCERADGYHMSHGGSRRGRAGGCIWDVLLMTEFVEWYDMLFPCMDDDFAAYLKENPVRYFGIAPKDGAEVKYNVELDAVVQLYSDYRSYFLDCNPGPPQAMLLKSALVLERQDLFEEYAKFIWQYADPTGGGHRMDLESLLIDQIDRDGFAGEVSLSYNGMWAKGFLEAAGYLKGTPYDPFAIPKFRKLGNMYHNFAVCDRFTLHIADCHGTGNPVVECPKDVLVKYFMETGEPEIAALLVREAGDDPICTDWFMDCAAADARIRQAAAQCAPNRPRSRCLPGYGLAVIESRAEGREPESNSVFFGSNGGHGHRDTLHLNVHGFGIDMMPDLGYPEFAGINPNRYRWGSNMVAHNTVTVFREDPYPVTGTDQDYTQNNIHPIKGGTIHHFHAGDKISVIDVEAPRVYDAPFGRTCVTVDLDGHSRYLIDLFEAGGDHQCISYHAIGTQVDYGGMALTEQIGGSYAGVDVPFEDEPYSRQFCDGFNYLKDVRRSAESVETFWVDWKCEDNWHVWDTPRDVHLKIHMLTKVAEAALCTGIPPRNKPGNPKAITYLLAKNHAPATRFVSVIEPYETESFIASVRRETYEAGAVEVLRVAHKSGREDFVIINRTGTPFHYKNLTAQGFVSVFSGKERYHYGAQRITGSVLDFTRQLCLENKITVRFDQPMEEVQLTGKFIDIETEVQPNAFFEIRGAEEQEDGTWVIDCGDCSFVSGFLDRTHKENGYRYHFAAGAAFVITL